ncbi:MAG: imidazole glycerol phosphate synthase subunit HisH [Lentisphaerae bacterium]|nr:imidazole glycerol phosphate synthase subunit HisH [Lentisphaerota bacterium]MCP4100684.1 imidazole glycerol phosphate synthase subunit HisH [Lentisphaerota bacterium]
MIALIDYNMGNLLSVNKALESIGGDIRIVDKASELEKFDSVILPGVGHFGDGMEHLRSRGFEPAVIKAAQSGKPLLGICLGMHMMLESSEEAPGVSGLGIFKGKVLKFPECNEKVPHMGWNSLSLKQNSKFFDGVQDNSYFYFVHSYYVAPENSDCIIGSCNYIKDFAAVIGKGNICATQFHPEKSQKNGLQILKNFIATTA